MAQNGDRIVRINDIIDIEWNSHDIATVDILLTETPDDITRRYALNEKQSDTTVRGPVLSSDEGINTFKWVVGYDDYTNFYGKKVFLAVKMIGSDNILDYSRSFEILYNITPDGEPV